jgi:translation initiation factor IF-3
VKAVVQFRGREIAHVDLGAKLLQRFSRDLEGVGQIEGQMKLEGKSYHVILSPVKTAAPGSKEQQKGHQPAPQASPGGEAKPN